MRRQDAYLRHHQAQALATLLWLLPLLLLGLAGLLLLTHLLGTQAFLFDLDLTWPVVRAWFVTFFILCAAWGLIWLTAMGLALAGSTRRAPLVRGHRSRLVQGLAMSWNSVLLAAVLLLAALAWHAQDLARTETGRPAPVYLLFDPRGYEAVGTWGPKMVFYRVSRQATARWGKGSVVVAIINRRTLTQALQHGRFVVLLCHGTRGTIVTSDLEVTLPRRWPRRGRFLDLISRQTGTVERVKAGARLQLLYNSGCNVGVRGSAWAWQRNLAPTEVITFPRVSGGLEHLWWIWAHAPERLKAIR